MSQKRWPVDAAFGMLVNRENRSRGVLCGARAKRISRFALTFNN